MTNKILAIRLDDELYTKVREESERTGLTITAIIKSSIYQTLGGGNGSQRDN